MTEIKFDLRAENSRAAIHERVNVISAGLQRAYREDGWNLVVVKNTPVLDTAIELASKTVMYHGIEAKDISNCKKFAHLCFWMLKLHPISFIRTADLVQITRAVAAQILPIHDDIIDVSPTGISSADAHLNQTVSLHTFATLVCDNFYTEEEAAKKIQQFTGSSAYREILRSIQFHNYSARTMAMYLESFVQDRML